jgi:hypothetical protein
MAPGDDTQVPDYAALLRLDGRGLVVPGPGAVSELARREQAA